MLFFVYGTLKSGYGNNRLLSTSKFLKTTRTVDRYVMYHVGFPYVVHQQAGWNEEEINNAGRVEGELYDVSSEAVVANLDRLESNGNFYQRAVRELETGEQAWIYEIIRERNYFRAYHGDLLTPDSTGTLRWGRG